ncbi:GGDEF domain-containing protein [Pseudomonas sp. nanlin1]|uniref:GGDEF domain-containing protein n=1 Tax=Pseudomonas sp. nanlin1 TaxID=3040605 RepID=UPI003890C627
MSNSRHYTLHLQNVLRLPNLLAHGFAAVAFPLSVILNPYLQGVSVATGWFGYAGMLLCSAVMLLSRRFLFWRLSLSIFVVFEGLAYISLIDAMGAPGRVWLLPVAVLICLGVTAFFSHLFDYLLSCICVWAMVLYGRHDLIVPSVDTGLLYLLIGMTLGMGALLSMTFLRALQTTHALTERYRTLAETDGLTGLENRRSLMAALDKACAETDGQSLHIAMLDIDDFKAINDRYGHAQGDAALTWMADAFRRCMGQQRYGRLGGEEFGVLFRGRSDMEVQTQLQDLLSTVRGESTLGFSFTFSGGIATWGPGADSTSLLKQADQQLYLAKRAGKSLVYWNETPVCR